MGEDAGVRLLGRAIRWRSRAAARLVSGLLRNLSDEAAYQRYLMSSGRTHSRAEWRLVWEDRLRRKYRRAKCC